MPQTIHRGIKTLIDEANAEIETISAADSIKAAAGDDVVIVDIRDPREIERDSMPEVLSVTASTEDGVAMALEHKTLPVAGVQFHPESLMSLGGEVGLRIVENAFRLDARVD